MTHKADKTLELKGTKAEVLVSLFDNDFNQVLIQPMVMNATMSKIIMSQVIDDGSPNIFSIKSNVIELWGE